MALSELYHKPNKTNLLKKTGWFNTELVIVRLGSQTDRNVSVGGVNGDGKIWLVDASFTSDDWLVQTVFHEIVHNFDTKNAC